MKKNGAEKKFIPLDELLERTDRELGSGYFPEKSEPESAEELPGSAPCIRFVLDDILMAVPLSTALEIGRQPRITQLPNLPGWMLGVSNIRGEIISIVDLKAFFGMAPPGLKRNQRFIILHNAEMKTGIVVDRIIGIYTPERIDTGTRSQLYRAADAGKMAWTAYVSGVVSLGDTVMSILDTDKLLSCPRMNAFRGE
ncbi:MAG: chemotaxis protein CheW [Desulfobacterales bacterium]